MSNLFKTPEWVNERNFGDVLKDYNIEFDTILKFEAFPALSDGENYITRIFRIKIDYCDKVGAISTRQFILKTCLDHTAIENEYHDLFLNEVDMYTKYIPEIEQMCLDLGSPEKFAPTYYQFRQVPLCDHILMEDLEQIGFRNEDRRVGLDLTHMEVVLRKLAKWHAATAKRVELFGVYDQNFRDGYFTEKDKDFIMHMNSVFNRPFLECLQSYNISERDKTKIQQYMDRLTELYLEFGVVHEDSFNVLNHGDFWVNNFMYQHDELAEERQVLQLMFVDWQLPKYGSPAQDLFCLLMTSPKLELKLEKFDYFIGYYHQNLLENLNKFNYQRKLPELGELQLDLRKHSLWSFTSAQRMLAVSLLDPNENANIETFMSDSLEGVKFKKCMFYNPRFKEQMELILPWLIERGFIN